VSDVTVTDSYPFDTAVFAAATILESTQSTWGFNAGFDVMQRLTSHFGLGVIGRYSRASLEFPIGAEQSVTIDAGGFQLGGGLRLQF
jgi:hypothetical protein